MSGGQTGVDRAAWDAAMELGMEQTGWVPKGRLAEDGVIPQRYRCQEISHPYYAARTVQNLLNSDATIILCFGAPSGGTQLTIKLCQKHRRPHLVIDLDEEALTSAIEQATTFLRDHNPERLNVAGLRGSSRTDVYERARIFLVNLFQSTS